MVIIYGIKNCDTMKKAGVGWSRKGRPRVQRLQSGQESKSPLIGW